MNRRIFLSLAGSCSAAALAGCASQPSPNPVPQTVLDYVATIAAALQKMLPALQSIIPANVFAQLTTWMGEAAALAAQIAQVSDSGASVAQLISQFGGIVGSILQSLNVSGLPTFVGSLLADIEALLPLILSLVGTRSFYTPRSARAGKDPQAAYADLQRFLSSR